MDVGESLHHISQYFQEYWFNHAMPMDVKYTDDMKSDMDALMKGWLKTKEYVNSNMKTSSSNSEDGKV